MGASTWLDRITDETNLWLSAAKAEEAKDYQSAAIQYLTDASETLGRGASVRAALSTFCAAECVNKMGADSNAKRLYFQSGKLYSNIADRGVSGSIRESLWALQRAYACYILAGRVKEAEAIKEAFKLLARRANPFSGGSKWLEMPEVEPRVPGQPSEEPSKELVRAIERFFSLAEQGRKRDPEDIDRPKRVGGLADDQEGFVSQLG